VKQLLSRSADVRGFGVEREVAGPPRPRAANEREAPQLGLELALAFCFVEPDHQLAHQMVDLVPRLGGAASLLA
jgi:hypothetical protein